MTASRKEGLECYFTPILCNMSYFEILFQAVASLGFRPVFKLLHHFFLLIRCLEQYKQQPAAANWGLYRGPCVPNGACLTFRMRAGGVERRTRLQTL